MDIIEEIWKDIEEYDCLYQISNMGRVRRKGKTTCLVTRCKGDIVILSVYSIYIRVNIAKIVAKYFLPAPSDPTKMKLVRLNRNLSDNRAINLKWEFKRSVEIEAEKKEKARLKAKLKAKIEAEKKEKARIVAESKAAKIAKIEAKIAKKARLKAEKKVIPKTLTSSYKQSLAIIQLRLNNDFVRRYIDMDELLRSHLTWDKEKILDCLSGKDTDAYGWRFVYEVDYYKD